MSEGPPKGQKNQEGAPSVPEDFRWDDVATVETAKGSVYRYLSDGTTQRFKKAEHRDYEPQSALVYVPDYAWVKEHAPSSILEKLGENEAIYIENLLEYIQNPRKEEDRKAYIVDKDGNQIETNEKIKGTKGPIYLLFLSKGVSDFSVPVSHKPKFGWMTFDTRRYVDEETGTEMRDRHLGNKVVKINLKAK